MGRQATEELLRMARGVRLAESGMGKSIRETAGVSQEAVGAAVGVSGAAVSLWETGQRVPQGPHAARYFDVVSALKRESESELLTGGA